jgi:hypothetical protein
VSHLVASDEGTLHIGILKQWCLEHRNVKHMNSMCLIFPPVAGFAIFLLIRGSNTMEPLQIYAV